MAVMAFCACTDYQSQIDQLQSQIDQLKLGNDDVNASAQSLQSLLEQIQAGSEVASFSPVGSGDAISGYVLTFENGESVTVYNSDCNISVGKDGDGYYWMVDDKFLEKDGQMVPIVSETVSPQFRNEEGNIQVSYDNGVSWDSVGSFGKPCIESVTEDNASVTFCLAGGSTIVIPKEKSTSLALSVFADDEIYSDEDNEVICNITGADESTQIFVYAPAGWTTKLNRTKVEKFIIKINPGRDINNGESYSVFLFVSDNRGHSVVAEVPFIGNEEPVLEGVPGKGEDPGDGKKSAIVGARVGAAGGKVAVKINTNLAYAVNCSEDWLTYAPAKAVRTESLELIAEPNTDGIARTATVTVTAGNYKVMAKVIQEGAAKEEVPSYGPTTENRFPILGYNSLTSPNATVENYRKLEEAGFTISLSGFASKGVQKEDRYFPDFYSNPSIAKFDAAFAAAGQTNVKLIIPLSQYAADHSKKVHLMPDGTAVGYVDVINRYKDNPALWGYQIHDEPTSPADMQEVRDMMDAISEVDPNHRFYTALLSISGWYTPSMNAGGIWNDMEGYLGGWFDIVQPTDMFNTDCYPVRYTTSPGRISCSREWQEGDEEYIIDTWYEGLAVDLKVAQERGVDFWGYTCTSRYSTEPAEPTYEGLMLQANTVLAYGGKGLIHFTVEAWNIDCFSAPFMEDGTTTRTYDYIKAVNRMVQNRADIFLNSDVKWVRHTKGTNRKALKWWRNAQMEIPARNTEFSDSDLAGDAVTSLSTDITAVISRFSANGAEYLMIQSKDHTCPTDVIFTNTREVYEIDKEARAGKISAGRHTYTIGKGDCLLLRLTD